MKGISSLRVWRSVICTAAIVVCLGWMLSSPQITDAADNKITKPNDHDLPFAYLEKIDHVSGGDKIWKDAKVKDALVKTLGNKRYKEFTKILRQPSDQGRFGDTLYFSLCKPHSCGSFYVDLFVSLKDASVQACWSDTESSLKDRSENPDVWLSQGSEKKLLTNACESRNYGASDNGYRLLFEKYGTRP